MDSTIKRDSITADDYERLAKLKAAYKVYRYDMRQKGAIETLDTEDHRDVTEDDMPKAGRV